MPSARSYLPVNALPGSLASTNPFRWLTVFGPGAIIASLTIGTGELIFSSRGGALFGYRILFLFLVISIGKWALMFSSARHMVLSGIHPLRRWVELPWGPRGWLPAVMFLFAVVCLPVWVSFHASVLGDLVASLTRTKGHLQGATVHLWGALVLFCVVAVAQTGGYAALERTQIVVVGTMLLAVGVALVLLQPDWLDMLRGAVWPRRLVYPAWLLADPRPEMQKIAAHPVWVEASLYVGVIGGASYDYLAYTSFLRDKRWGMAGAYEMGHASESHGPWPPFAIASEEVRRLKEWVRAPLIDCTLSFVVVFAFSAVFVASGWLVLGPRRQLPSDGSFLDHQAQFVTQLHPWLFPIYAAGTLLAMLGTLYGTLEVAPALLRELVALLRTAKDAAASDRRLRTIALAWTACGAFGVLAWSFFVQASSGRLKPPGLTSLLIPANLFTGVLSCGIICLLNPWMDCRLPIALRHGAILRGMNWIAGCAFVFLGVKGYWDFGGVGAMAILVGTVAFGGVVAFALRGRIAD